MKKIFFLALLAIAFTSASAQKKIYDENVQVREAKDFNAIRVSGGIDLFISNGDEAVAVSASEVKHRDKIKVEVENGVLKIWYDESNVNKIVFNEKRNLRAYVSYKNLQKLVAMGGCDVIVEGSIKAKSFVMNISAGSDFKGRLEVEDLKVDQSAGSDIEISGWARTATIDATSGSDFSGFNFNTEVCTVRSAGGSDVEISVSKELTAHASGASDVNYKGNPSVKNLKTSGASSVSKKS